MLFSSSLITTITNIYGQSGNWMLLLRLLFFWPRVAAVCFCCCCCRSVCCFFWTSFLTKWSFLKLLMFLLDSFNHPSGHWESNPDQPSNVLLPFFSAMSSELLALKSTFANFQPWYIILYSCHFRCLNHLACISLIFYYRDNSKPAKQAKFWEDIYDCPWKRHSNPSRTGTRKGSRKLCFV